jgi:predicted dienelactone hydrolase
MRPNFGKHSSGICVIGAKAFGIAVLTAISILNEVSTSVQAAQTVVVRRGSFTQSIELTDLKTFVKTGKGSPSLQEVARRLTPEQRSQIQAALKAKYNINQEAARNFVNTGFGNNLSSALASTTPRQDSAGVQAVKTALIQGAKAPEGLSLISAIEGYPSPRLDVDLDQAFRVVGNFNAAFWQTQAFMAAIAPQLAPNRPQLNLPFDPTQPGSASVQVLNLNLIDWERRREIPVDIYWSTQASSAKPLIVFSHGLGSVRTDMRYLAEHLASHGYVVAALEHPGSNEAHVKQALQLKAPLLEAQEFLNRPKDISFILDRLETLNQAPGFLQGKLAPERVMVIGYSLGGTTALSIAGAQMQLDQLKQRCPGDVLAFSLGENAQCFAKSLPKDRYQLRDPRVKGAIAFSPVTSLLFGETGMSKLAVPTLITAASADKTAPALTEQIVSFDKMPSPKWLVGVVGATHLSVKDPSTTIDQAGQPDTLYSGGEIVGEEAVDVRNYVKAIALAMAAQLTNDAAKYALFLTPEYAQYASTPAFPIRLVTKIPPKAEAIIKDFIQKQPNSQGFSSPSGDRH